MIGLIDGVWMIILSPALGIRTKINMLEICMTICYRAITYHCYWFRLAMPQSPAYGVRILTWSTNSYRLTKYPHGQWLLSIGKYLQVYAAPFGSYVETCTLPVSMYFQDSNGWSIGYQGYWTPTLRLTLTGNPVSGNQEFCLAPSKTMVEEVK